MLSTDNFYIAVTKLQELKKLPITITNIEVISGASHFGQLKIPPEVRIVMTINDGPNFTIDCEISTSITTFDDDSWIDKETAIPDTLNESDRHTARLAYFLSKVYSYSIGGFAKKDSQYSNLLKNTSTRISRQFHL